MSSKHLGVIRLLPDNLGNIADNLSLLDIAEAIIVGTVGKC